MQEVKAYLAELSGVLQNCRRQPLLHLVNAQHNILHKQRQRKYPTPPSPDGGNMKYENMNSKYNPTVNVEHFTIFALLDSANNSLALLSIVPQTFL